VRSTTTSAGFYAVEEAIKGLTPEDRLRQPAAIRADCRGDCPPTRCVAVGRKNYLFVGSGVETVIGSPFFPCAKEIDFNGDLQPVFVRTACNMRPFAFQR
jgi:hypothetical protein